MLCALSQSYRHLFLKKIIYASYNKLPKELKNDINNLCKPSGSWVIDQNANVAVWSITGVKGVDNFELGV